MFVFIKELFDVLVSNSSFIMIVFFLLILLIFLIVKIFINGIKYQELISYYNFIKDNYFDKKQENEMITEYLKNKDKKKFRKKKKAFIERII